MWVFNLKMKGEKGMKQLFVRDITDLRVEKDKNEKERVFVFVFKNGGIFRRMTSKEVKILFDCLKVIRLNRLEILLSDKEEVIFREKLCV
jgi:hypothetical protein